MNYLISFVTLLGLGSFGVIQAFDFDWDKVEPIDQVYPLPKTIPHTNYKINNNLQITGGNESEPHQFPNQAAILVQMGKRVAFCGGSLISKKYVLTAAHCALLAKNFTVILGAHKIKENETSQQVFQTKHKIVHPKWIWSQLQLLNDIALIVLPTDAVLNEYVQPARLPSRSQARESFVGVRGTVSGWGKDSDASNTVSPVLRYVSNKIMSNIKCTLMLMGAIKPSHICLSGSHGRSSCNGDSGGPLIITDMDKKVTQIGIVSFGISFGCEKGFPSAYTRITSHLNFIGNHSDVTIRD